MSRRERDEDQPGVPQQVKQSKKPARHSEKADGARRVECKGGKDPDATVEVTKSQNGNAAFDALLSQQRDRREDECGTDALSGAHTHLPILRPLRLSPLMSLADASEVRKARLLTLRKRRAGESEEGAGYGLMSVPTVSSN